MIERRVEVASSYLMFSLIHLNSVVFELMQQWAV